MTFFTKNDTCFLEQTIIVKIYLAVGHVSESNWQILLIFEPDLTLLERICSSSFCEKPRDFFK